MPDPTYDPAGQVTQSAEQAEPKWVAVIRGGTRGETALAFPYATVSEANDVVAAARDGGLGVFTARLLGPAEAADAHAACRAALDAAAKAAWADGERRDLDGHVRGMLARLRHGDRRDAPRTSGEAGRADG